MYMVSVLQRLLEGRINQLKGTVIITKCANRTFAAAQWRELRDQLAAWKVTFCITRLPSLCSSLQLGLCLRTALQHKLICAVMLIAHRQQNVVIV